MAHTNQTEVGKVIEVDEDIDLGPFIKQSEFLVNEHCLASGYSNERLSYIATYLAAHLYGVRDRETQVSAETVWGAIATNFRGKADLGLNLTHQGQQAMFFDYLGNLAKINREITSGGPQTFAAVWLGDECRMSPDAREEYEEP